MKNLQNAFVGRYKGKYQCESLNSNTALWFQYRFKRNMSFKEFLMKFLMDILTLIENYSGILCYKSYYRLKSTYGVL